jgi:phage baseplate assembly protein W
MATAREIRSLVEQTTTGTRRGRIREEVKQQVRRYSARRRVPVNSPSEFTIAGEVDNGLE